MWVRCCVLNDAQNNLHNIITHHALFTLAKIKIQTAMFLDPSDIQNLDYFKCFLMNSLDMKFQCALIKYSGFTMNGPILWKLFVLKSQSNSLHALMVLTQELQKIELKK